MSNPGSGPDPIVRHGTVLLPEMIVEYDIWQPAPTQWVAIGLARPLESTRQGMLPSLITGTGTTEIEAIHDLCHQLMAPTWSPRVTGDRKPSTARST